MRPFTLRTFDSRGLYCSNFGPTWRQADLREAFTPYGDIFDTLMKKVGNPDAFGFVFFSQPNEATRALKALRGKVVGGKNLVVRYHEPLHQDLFRASFPASPPGGSANGASWRQRQSNAPAGPGSPDAASEPSASQDPQPDPALDEARRKREDAEAAERAANAAKEAAEAEERAAQQAVMDAAQAYETTRAEQREADAAVEEAERMLRVAKERQLAAALDAVHVLAAKLEAEEREQEATRRHRTAEQELLARRTTREDARLAEEAEHERVKAQSRSEPAAPADGKGKGKEPEWGAQARQRQEENARTRDAFEQRRRAWSESLKNLGCKDQAVSGSSDQVPAADVDTSRDEQSASQASRDMDDGEQYRASGSSPNGQSTNGGGYSGDTSTDEGNTSAETGRTTPDDARSADSESARHDDRHDEKEREAREQAEREEAERREIVEEMEAREREAKLQEDLLRALEEKEEEERRRQEEERIQKEAEEERRRDEERIAELEESIRRMKILNEQEGIERREKEKQARLQKEREAQLRREAEQRAQAEAERAREEAERNAQMEQYLKELEQLERTAVEAQRLEQYQEAAAKERIRCQKRDAVQWNIRPDPFSKRLWTPQWSIRRFQTLCAEFDEIKFGDAQPLTFQSIPWPMLHYPPDLTFDLVNWSAVEQFFLAAKGNMSNGEYKNMVEKAHRRFHPDKWRSRGLLNTVLDEELRKRLEDAGNVVAQAITPLWLASKTSR
ncbi:hypothetical protein PsYK624_087460 [Phanerochaete sordida]|uniref:RRM domain-containing protein n=1 Tax=Phanerochaete sordida TaxID=48140 RepID=A0A9P3LEJ4_9APHY|nr:hypothetical protein PsYK624_087460 [Phanerochaete sordida]